MQDISGKYRRTNIAEMRPWQPGERLSALVSISASIAARMELE